MYAPNLCAAQRDTGLATVAERADDAAGRWPSASDISYRSASTPPHSIATRLQSPNTERSYREALKKAQLLDGAADDIPALKALRAAVDARLPVVAPPQMVSTADALRERIVELAKAA